MLSLRQQSFIEHSDAFISIADGAVRSGKTHASMIRFAKMCGQGPPGDFAVFGKTERTVKRNVVYPLKEGLPKGSVEFIQGSGELYVFGRRCWVIGANDVRAEEKARGLTLAGSYLNEVTLYPENIWQTIIDRHSVDGAQILGDCNPDSPYHWLHKDYLAANKPQEFISRWRFRLDDNPILGETYKRNLEIAHPPGTLWHKRMVLGEWVVAEGAIYEQWDERTHVVDRMPGIPEKVIIAIDYGTQNATVFLALGLVRGVWYVFAEYYYSGRTTGRQKTDAEYSLDLASFIAGTGYFPQSVEIDPSAASFKAQLRRDGMTNLRDADNSVVDGIRTVSTALSGGRLKVLKQCEGLREEFPSYAWDEKSGKKGKEQPLKGEGVKDHALDALRYGCMRAIGRPTLHAVPKPVGA